MKTLIINADDMGASKGINQGIINAFEHGALFSTSIVVNLCAFESACLYLIQNQDLYCGLHINLTVGRPVSMPEKVGSLLDRNGRFWGPWQFATRLYKGRVKTDHVWREMNAQMEKALQVGLYIRHLDSHHHVHVLAPLNKMVKRLAREYRVTRIRKLSWPNTNIAKPTLIWSGLQQATLALLAGKDRARNQPFYGLEFARSSNKMDMARIILNTCLGRGEWMCHPALFVDEDMHKISHYLEERVKELQVLTDPEILALISRVSVQPRH